MTLTSSIPLNKVLLDRISRHDFMGLGFRVISTGFEAEGKLWLDETPAVRPCTRTRDVRFKAGGVNSDRKETPF